MLFPSVSIALSALSVTLGLFPLAAEVLKSVGTYQVQRSLDVLIGNIGPDDNFASTTLRTFFLIKLTAPLFLAKDHER